MNTFTIRRLTDPAAIRAFLNRDRALTAYSLGDLDEAFWPRSAFYGAYQGEALAAVLLVYRGFDPPILSGCGDRDGMAAILADPAVPAEIYYLFPVEFESALGSFYDLSHRHLEWRMVLDPAAFHAPALDGVQRLTPEQAGELAALYRHAAGPGEEVVAFDPWQIAQGVFYGVWADGLLVATAGTHVWSVAERVAAIGNVFTMPAFRGRGYATACTAAVARDALAAGLDTVVLNVKHDNAPAIRVYAKLGFRQYHLFIEGPGLRHSRKE